MHKLKVAHIITQLELGGAQQNTLYTLERLDRNRFDPILACGMGGILENEARQGNFPTHFVSCLQREIHPLLDSLAMIQLYRWLRRSRPHIVHTHSSKAGILGRAAAYLAGVPVIVHTFHGFGFTPTQSERKRGLLMRLEKACAFLARHLIFVSDHNRREAEESRIAGRATTSIIRSGIAMRDAEPAPIREELGLAPNAWLVTSVGNFKPQKNPLALVAVACGAARQDPDIHFCLVGDGELKEQAAAFVRDAGLADRVHFLGWRRDAPQLLAASDCFLLTSLWEGLPRALVEAFAARKPAVAYAVNGVNDILVEGENGFPIRPGETVAAVEKILWLKAHPEEAKEMGAAGRRRVEEEFDIDRMVRAQEALYEQLWARVPLKEHYEGAVTNPT